MLNNLAFKIYHTAGCKIQVRDLLRNRLDLKEKIRYYKKKVQLNLDKIKEIETVTLISVEKKLNFYLEKAK